MDAFDRAKHDVLNRQFDDHKMSVEVAIESMLEFLETNAGYLDLLVWDKGYDTQKISDLFKKAHALIAML